MSRDDDNRCATTGGGYGKPPLDTRFKPGQRANPKGRPPGRTRPELPHVAVLNQSVSVRENGVVKVMTARQAFELALVQKVHQANTAAAELLLSVYAKAKEKRPGFDVEPISLCITVVSGKGATREIEILGIGVTHDAYRPTARTMLQPWIVEAALDRLGEEALNAGQQAAVWKVTRTPRKVRWPDWWTYYPSD